MSPSSSPLSSPLSSVASRSPTPPGDYPSPPSSNASDKETASGSRDAQGDVPDSDGPPPAKRQKIAKTRELKTEYLDLQKLIESEDELHHKTQDAKLTRLMEALRTKRKIVVIAGAGISVSAGIPDFRSSNGLFATLRTQHKLKASGKHLFDASVYRSDSSTTSFHTMVRELSHLTQTAEPTAFHHMLATLAEEGRLLRLYTQNVDGIDTSLEPLATTVPLNAKGPWPKTIQLHGGLGKMVCSKCGHLADFDGALFEGPEPPACEECETIDTVRQASGLRSHGVGRLRPRMVLYNEFNPDEEAIGAVSHADLKTRPDAVIVVGTSLKVPGIRRLAKEMCSVSRGKRGGFTAWINYDPEPVGIEFKDCWDMVVRGECDEVARLVNFPKWNEKDLGEYTIVKSEEVEKSNTRPEVVVESYPITSFQPPAMPTPVDSPRQQSPTSHAPAKLKQISLSFAGGLASEAPASRPADAKKKRGRKPLPSMPTKPMSAIKKTFGASKTTKSIESKPVKVASKSAGPTSPYFPSLHKTTPSSPMRPVSPFETRNNKDLSSLKAPETPKPVVEVPVYQQGTISPKSVPTGMAHLLS
ncbi:DHS-like NAD/FAD-binding domain-containing protein [Mollisia scopiformis]|uniref:DHS-like NAD/FAD-binding domain-containing protein n=1 Tax=Mollisia scopiformis TaxID=149040 RepID=A0A194XKW3_MOLSC|nr:DHS-like NAD/FAD-binding domain-containing protein [Mollisia scopiformis]KUJ20417.1 DHS-like NAD/FAD-binding domain-containing protein [Mollisia scopiformis]